MTASWQRQRSYTYDFQLNLFSDNYQISQCTLIKTDKSCRQVIDILMNPNANQFTEQFTSIQNNERTCQ